MKKRSTTKSKSDLQSILSISAVESTFEKNDTASISHANQVAEDDRELSKLQQRSYFFLKLVEEWIQMLWRNWKEVLFITFVFCAICHFIGIAVTLSLGGFTFLHSLVKGLNLKKDTK